MESLKFEYQNARGEQYEWELVNWVEEDDYIRGVAIPGLGYRTFRKDRVIQFLPSDQILTRRSPGKPRPPEKTERPFEICFTGFDVPERPYLEALATECKMLVRTRVTKNLDFLVTGDEPGPVKLKEATDKGVIILDTEGFFRMIQTGEIG